jgi:hypothetical protein
MQHGPRRGSAPTPKKIGGDTTLQTRLRARKRGTLPPTGRDWVGREIDLFLPRTLEFPEDRPSALFEPQDQLAQIVVADDGSSLWDWKPPNPSLPVFRPLLQLRLHQQGKDLNLAGKGCDQILHPFLVHIPTKRPAGNMATDTGLLVRLARSRLLRLETLDRPAFWYDPSPGFAGGDKQDFDASLFIKPIRQGSELNTPFSVPF